MNIAYASQFAADSVHSWSGLIYHIRRALIDAGCTVETIDSLKEHGRISGRLLELGYKHLARENYNRYRRPIALEGFARQVEAALNNKEVDAILSPSCFPLAGLKPGSPAVLWSDATFAGLVDFYPYTTNLSKRALREGHACEQRMLDRCSLAIFSSDWAARTALENYEVNTEKVKVVPYGANVEKESTLEQVMANLEKRAQESCELLFMGVEWERKGGQIAVETAQELNRRGLPTKLHIVGCDVPGAAPDFVIQHGFVSKKTPEGREKLDALLSNSHFLILPSRAECCALVLAEASSYGLPSLAADVGGVSTIVKTDLTGQLLPLAARGEAYAEKVIQLMNDPEAYRKQALAAHAHYHERLNWRVAGNTVVELIRTVI